MTKRNEVFVLGMIGLPLVTFLGILTLIACIRNPVPTPDQIDMSMLAANQIMTLCSLITAALTAAGIFFLAFEVRLKSATEESTTKKFAVYKVLIKKQGTGRDAYSLQDIMSTYRQIERTEKLPRIKNEDELENILILLMWDHKADMPVEGMWVPVTYGKDSSYA